MLYRSTISTVAPPTIHAKVTGTAAGDTSEIAFEILWPMERSYHAFYNII